MIKDFLIINFTGKNNSIALRTNSKFFIKKFQTNMKNNKLLVNNIFQFIKQKNAYIDKNFSVIVNVGPGSFSSIRVSISVAIGIKISMKTKLFGYSNKQMNELSLENIEFLIDKNKLENKLIKPIYIS